MPDSPMSLSVISTKGVDMAETADKIAGGLSVEDFLERECGGVHHKAVLLLDLGSAAETARSEWEYDTESPEAVNLVRLCAELDDYLKDLSITADGELTRYRECSRCSGNGKTRGEDPCIECGGVGAVHADEADG